MIQAQRWLIFVTLLISLVLGMTVIPEPWRTVIFLLVVMLVLMWGFKQSTSIPLPHLPSALLPDTPLPRHRAALEILALVGIALSATHVWWLSDATYRLSGGETEWTTGLAQVAQRGLHEHGVIPLWNPYYRQGEPLIDNAHSFILNPLSISLPLIFGNPQGIKYGAAFHIIFAGVGGWVLARTLNLGALGRLLLGCFMIGNGATLMTLQAGYYQLGTQQTYFAWITAGALQIMRGRDRTSVVLTALMTTLIFWAGNVWYILPMLINMGVIALTHTFNVHPHERINWRGWRRMSAAALLTLCLSAMYTLPILAHYDHIGDHADEVQAGAVIVDRFHALTMIFREDPHEAWLDLRLYLPADDKYGYGLPYIYYAFMVPAWFAALIFVLIPPSFPLTYVPSLGKMRRIWWTAAFMIALMMMWGMGGTPLWVWLYEQIPLLRGWRFVGRAFAVAAFWVAIVVVMRLDGFWRATSHHAIPYRHVMQWATLIVSAFAIWQPLSQWNPSRGFGTVVPASDFEQACFASLRRMIPNDEISVWSEGYESAAAYLDHEIRLFRIGAEFLPLPDPNTLGTLDADLWLSSLPPYALLFYESTRRWFVQMGYRWWWGGPQADGVPCLYHDPERAMPYAYSYETLGDPSDPPSWVILPQRHTIPYEHLIDTIALVVMPREFDQLLIVRETAYPGWEVWVNDQAATLEVYGGYLSVRLPHSESALRVVFMYRPPLLLWGSLLTLISAVLCIVYLLRLEQIVKCRLIYRR